jgi:hypothetical protein
VPKKTEAAIEPTEQPDTAPITAGESGFEMRYREIGEDAQPALFPTEDLLIPETLRTMRKAVAAIHAIPVKAEHAQSLNSRRLFDAIILVVQLNFRKRPKAEVERIKADRISPLFDVRITELARLANIPGKNYQRIYEELDKLFEMDLRWNVVGEDSEVEWDMRSHFLASLGHGKGLQRGLIRFSMDPSILNIVLEPSNWASLSLQVMASLLTAPSYALYVNTWRYVTTTAKVTAPLPTATWVELLMGKSRYVVDDPATGKRVVNYGDFKRRVLLDAIRRVNEVAALNYTIELKEIRSGTRVSRLQFKFVQKTSHGLGLPLHWPDDVLAALKSLGHTETEIKDISEARSYEEVAEALIRLKAAEDKLRSSGKKISSKKAYFNGILSNIALGSSDDELDHEKIEAEVKAQSAAREAQERLERLSKAFERHQAITFTANLFAADEDYRADVFQRFEQSTDGEKAKLLLRRGWDASNAGALAMLRTWMQREHPDELGRLLPNPEDKGIEAWTAWRADQAMQ